MKINLETKVARLKLSSPIICASGTFGFGDELKGLVDFDCIGAIVTKTITLKPHKGNLPPRIFELDYGIINSIGLENPGLEMFLKEKLPRLKKLKTKFIVSIGGFSLEEYEEIIKELNKIKSIEAIELNLSCPNIKLKKIISQSKSLTYKLLKSLREKTDKVLIAKITPEVTDVVEIAKVIKNAQIDAVSLVNTFRAIAVDIDEQKPILGNIYGGYSGRAIKPLSLYRVWCIAKNVDIPIIGGGGIENTKDAIEFILAGATCISLGTVNLVYPNKAKEILKGIKDYLRKKKIESLEKIRGVI
jgi:dihydroorotate dehydrogenase (NAD+) catalytic subunit